MGNYVVGACFFDCTVVPRDVFEEGSYIARVELVGIEADTPPVAQVHLVSEGVESTGSKSDMEGSFVAEKRDDTGLFDSELLDDFPGAVGATVVDNDDAVAPSAGIAQAVGDDIGFILDNEKTVDFHIRSRWRVIFCQ